MFRPLLVRHQRAYQSLHKTMFGLILYVEELLVIFRVWNCYTVNKSSEWIKKAVEQYCITKQWMYIQSTHEHLNTLGVRNVRF
jgi:hypothetical protein